MSKVSECVALAASSALLLVSCAPEDGPGEYVLATGTQGNDSSVTITGDQVAFAGVNAGARFGMRTTRIGRERGGLEMPPVESSRGLGDLVVLDRGMVEERFRTTPKGLEQSWLLHARPEGMGELAIEVCFEGVTPSLRVPGVAQLRDEEGWARAQYRDLSVSDATGRAVPSRMEVVGDAVRLVIDDSGAAYPVLVDPLIATEQKKLVAGDGDMGGTFASTVSLDADTAIIAKPGDPNQPGAAYVYLRSGSSWALQAKLSAPPGLFGSSVSVSGNTAVVGAPAQAGLQPSGTAYVFVRIGTTWSEQANLVPSHSACKEVFGSSVAVSGDTIIVGGGCADGPPWGIGEAYVFVRSGTTWSEQATLAASDPEPSTAFGESVTIADDTAIVGARWKEQPFGAAYVFVRNGEDWSQQAKLAPAHTGEVLEFGASVSLTANTAVIGSPESHGQASFSGAAEVYVRSGDVWSHEAWLTASDGGDFDSFGKAVSISGNRIVIGAPYRGAYVYLRDGTTWLEQMKLTPSDGIVGVWGLSVAASSDDVIVGEPGNGNHVGAAYVYQLEEAPAGRSCASGVECETTFCVDGVCCDSSCGGGSTTDCQACSQAAGAPVDGTCSVVSNGWACGNGNTCVSANACQAGVCTAINPPPCAASDQCHEVGTCDETTGICSNPARPDGVGCDDGDPNTVDDVCTAGVCAGVDHCIDVTCVAKDDCRDAVCLHATGACLSQPKADGTLCSDGTCEDGVCVRLQMPDAGPDSETLPDAEPDVEVAVDAGVDAVSPVDAAVDGSSDSAPNPRSDTFALGGGCGCRTTHTGEGDAGWLAVFCFAAMAARRRRDTMS